MLYDIVLGMKCKQWIFHIQVLSMYTLWLNIAIMQALNTGTSYPCFVCLYHFISTLRLPYPRLPYDDYCTMDEMKSNVKES